MITFIGAGPGDPDLITVKGRDRLAGADVVVYAGSLVNPQLLGYCKGEAKIYNSAGMTLEEVLEVLEEGHAADKSVVRLHTGDPSLYGATQEQMDALKKKELDFEVIPGVSSFLAAAAAIPHELTLPGVTQTVILTRMEGRTPVPPAEKLSALAGHGATMVIFLSVHQIEGVVQELLQGGYTLETPVLVVEKASWPDQVILSGNLQTIARQVSESGIKKTALIMVGEVFKSGYQLSCLYDKKFSHGYRDAKK